MKNLKYLFLSLLILESNITFPMEDSSDYNKISYAYTNRDIHKIRNLIEANVDINSKNNYGASLLAISSYEGREEVVLLLINNNADINIKDVDGFTPLMLAVYNGNLKIAQLLIENGADINAKSKHSDTALIFACQKGHAKIVSLLINAKVNINEQCSQGKIMHIKSYNCNERFLGSNDWEIKDGYTPLAIAAFYGHKETVEILIQNGADMKIKNSMNKTPFDLANDSNNKNWGSIKVAQILQNEEKKQNFSFIKSNNK